MKKCLNCNHTVEDGTFCPICGSMLVEATEQNAVDQIQNFGAGAQPDYSVPVQPIAPAITQPVAQKKKSKAAIAIIVVFVMVAIGAIGYTVGNLVTKTKYTKGEVKDGCYINEWANIKYEIADDMSEGSKEEYDSYEGENTECGFVASNPNKGKQLAIAFEKVPSGTTQNKYLDTFEKNLKKKASSYDMSLSTKRGTITVAGEKYDTIEVENDEYGANQYYCIRKIDNRIVCIVVTDLGEENVKATLERIKPAK